MIDLDELERLAKDANCVPNVPDVCLLNTDFARRAAFRKVCSPDAILDLVAEVRALRARLETPLLTGAYAPMYGGVFAVEGISHEAAESALYAGATTVTIYYGERRIFTCMSDFMAAHPKEAK
ncbi:hypothetical protein [Burkholderia ubonensis]|uniref:hypothetical protein n=1 Tax=Burkholderia ubonensis TaxID=101571 RepID=UPI00075277F9|nr:hypothetical protein [Burkholderia ubonensis]KVC81404.1 hypothetical protein WI75_08635 [Burkholderia ubonensis]